MANPPLNLSFLGAPEVTLEGKRIKFPSRKTLALLVYLAVTGLQHPRQHLMALFWPNSDARRASASLRTAVARLRHTLGPTRDIILGDNHTLAFDWEKSVHLDLYLLKQAAAPEALPETMQIALAAIRGEFLEGFSLPNTPEFDHWLSIYRERCYQLTNQVYQQLVRHCLLTGQSHQALRMATRWIAHAPLSEKAYRSLMEAHLLNQDRAAALEIYARCLQMLNRELALPPSPETVALARRITAPPDPARSLPPLPVTVRSRPHARDPLREGQPLPARAKPRIQWATLYGQADTDTGTPDGTGYRTAFPGKPEEMLGGTDDFSDFLETLSGMGDRRGNEHAMGFEDIFDSGFGPGTGADTHSRPTRGRDIEHPIDITLEEAYRGATRVLQVDGERIEVRTPRGVKTGSWVRVAGKGEPSRNGGKPGDLYLKINVLPHARFQREGDNLRLKLPVDLHTLILGGEIEVPTLERAVTLSIPPETDNGEIFRLRSKGMPNLEKPDQHGDLYVEVSAKLPKNLTEQEKELLRRFRALRPHI